MMAGFVARIAAMPEGSYEVPGTGEGWTIREEDRGWLSSERVGDPLTYYHAREMAPGVYVVVGRETVVSDVLGGIADAWTLAELIADTSPEAMSIKAAWRDLDAAGNPTLAATIAGFDYEEAL